MIPDVLSSGLLQAIDALTPVDLAVVDDAARLLVRRDRKYLVPTGEAARLAATLGEQARVLEIDGARSFRYESIYFDTPDLRAFHATARRRTRRFKVRTRAYLDSGRCVVELKVRDARGTTSKRRLEYAMERRHRLDAGAVAFVSTCPLVGPDGNLLRPVLRTRYRRTTLLVDGRTRLTIDRDLESATTSAGRLSLVGMVVVETKTPGRPSSADRLLWAMGHRPIAMSKFATTLAALEPGLPTNRWTRALARSWLREPARRPAG